MTSQGSKPIDIYGRVSRASDERMRSTTGQVEDCRARLDDLDLPLGMVHVDNSRSAWNPRVRRPGWDALMARLESGEAGGVIVFDLARFSRRPIEGERLIEAAERGLTILDSESEYDLTTPSGKKAFRDQMSAAAYESDRLSTRTSRGKRLKARRGEPNVSSRPFGFEPDGVTIRDDEAALLRDWTERLLAGVPIGALIDEANERGILTAYGKPWTRAGFRQVLTRQRNAGRVVHAGQVVATMSGEPIIDPHTFDQVVALFAARRSGRPPSPQYVCSGVAVCGVCGKRLGGRPRVNMKPYDDGAVRRQYWCAKSNGGCGRISVDQRALDDYARTLTVAILSDRRHAAEVEAATRTANDRVAQLDAKIAELDALAEELAARLGRAEMPLARYDAAVRPLDRQLAELRAERAAIPDTPRVIGGAASRAAWARRWDAAEPDERRTLLRQALRGRALIVDPADRANRSDVPGRVRVD